MDFLLQCSSEGLAARLLSYFHEPSIRRRLFSSSSSSSQVIAKEARLVSSSLPILSLSNLTCDDIVSEDGALTWFLGCDLIRRNVCRCYILPSLALKDDESVMQHGFLASSSSRRRLINLPFMGGREELFADIVKGLATIEKEVMEGMVIRLSCCPKNLEQFLVESLPAELQISPRGYSHALMVVEEQGEEGGSFRWSLVSKEWLYLQASDDLSTHPDSVAHAVNKIEEALTISRAIYPPLHDEFESIQIKSAIDLGAAPGAWTGHLADLGSFVIAVDPSALDPSIVEKPAVVHLQMKAEEAGDKIIALLDEKGQSGKADLLVSDMNIHPSEASRLVTALLPYVRAGGLLIFTLKYHGKGQSQSKRDEGERQLNLAFGHWVECGRVFTLLANTNFEQTYIGRVK